MYILYVVPPFYELSYPAIGVSNLNTITRNMGHESKILYENISLLKDLPLSVYHFVTNNQASMTLLLGDFIYSLLRIPENEREEAINRYLEKIVAVYILDHPRVLNAYRDFLLKTIPIIEQAGLHTIRRILAEGPDVIGFTIGSYQLHASLYLAKKIKEIAPEKQIWFGGSYCTGQIGRKILEYFSYIDIVFTGESEKSLEAVLKNLKKGNLMEEVNGVVTREISNPGKEYPVEKLCPQMVEDLDELPIPDYMDYFDTLNKVDEAKGIKPYLLMETSRGCWWAQKGPCYFCGLNMQTKTYRTKSARRVLGEISGHIEKYGISRFVMVDNVLNQHFIKDLFPLLKAGFHNLKLFYEVRSSLSKDELGTLHEAGVNLIQVGVEALDHELLDLLHKGTHPCQNIQIIKWCEELDIHIIYNLLYAIPGESKEAYRRVLALMKNIHHLRSPSPSRLHLDRDSVYDLESERFGIQKNGVNPTAITHCFPEQHIDPLLIVHNYSNSIKNLDRSLPVLWAELIDEIWAWQEDYYKKNKILSYKIKDGIVYICDDRFSNEKQYHTLDEVESAIFIYCDTGRSKEAILKNTTLFSTNDINKGLERLCERKLVYPLDDRYISLAVKENQGQEIRQRSKRNFKSESYPSFQDIPEISKDFPWIYKNSAKFFGFKYRYKHLFEQTVTEGEHDD